ncbi:MAG: protein translocase subunit SecF [bacterium]
MQLFSRTNIDFIGQRKVGYMVSSALIVLGLAGLIYRGGLNLGVDFRGGVSIRVQFSEPVEVEAVRTSIAQIGFGNAELKKSVLTQNNRTVEEYIIRVLTAIEGDAGEEVVNHLKEDFGDENVEIRSAESVGPKIGGELRRATIYAVLLSLFFILIYVSWRFELRFAVGAVIPLFHDVLVTLGIFALFDLEITLHVVAAFLTIVGYSLNDTIVVFDRIRENLKVLRRETYTTIVNRSLNETLSRTIVTSMTTLFVVLVLFTFGGDVIHNFSIALIVGVAVGTYSSIFVASPILVEWENRKARREGSSSTAKRR